MSADAGIDSPTERGVRPAEEDLDLLRAGPLLNRLPHSTTGFTKMGIRYAKLSIRNLFG